MAIYYSKDARATAVSNIKKLIPQLASIPGNVMDLTAVENTIYYLGVLRDAIVREQREENKAATGKRYSFGDPFEDNGMVTM